MMVTPKLAVIAALALLCGTVSASDIDDAIQSMRAGDFAEAYCILKPYAERGDAEAQYNIGWMYLNGYGLAMNDSLALEWWQRASDQGYTDASFSIAMLYSLGEGQVRKDMDKAIDYYLLAAEAGHEDARQILRSMLARDDKYMRKRKQDIISTYGNLLGDLYRIKVERANLRATPSLEGAIVTRLLQGDIVIELGNKDKWSHVAITTASQGGEGEVAWIYSSLLESIESIKVMSDEAAGKAANQGNRR